MTDTVTAPARQDTKTGDHDRFAHWVLKWDIVKANVTGTPAVALCGKRWIPNRVPDEFPVCPVCDEVKRRMFDKGGAE